MFNMQEFQNAFSTLHCTVSKHIYMSVQCAYGVFLHCTECALNHECFMPRYRSDPALYSTLTATKMYSYTLFLIYKSFKLLFHYDIVL